MRRSTTSTTRVLTIFSLVVLCTLSFAVVYGTEDIVDTQHQDSIFSFHKRNIPHHRRAKHHLKLSNTPSLTPSSASSPTPSDSQAPSVASTSKSSSATPVSSSTSSTPASSSTHSSASLAESSSTPKTSDTTSTTPTSSKPSSTPSSTPSSLSGTSSSPSSNTSPTTSTASSISNPAIVGVTTPLASNSPVTSGSPFTPDNPTSTVYAASTATASSQGFLANKAAAGVTFAIVGIIGGLVVIVAATKVMRRRRRAKYDEDEFYEKYPGHGGSADHSSREPAEPGLGPLEEEMTDVTHAAPLDAYPDRAIHYGQPNPSTVFRPVDYGIDYPPNAAYADPVDAPGRSDAYAYDAYDYDQNRPGTASTNSHPFADPANASRAAFAPPVTYPRPIHGRAQEMVATDSYYGPNTAGVGVGLAQ